jgi:pimeloyl-ACP methyl ester carboxylesterase
MARLSRQVKETIKIVAVVLVIGILLFFYWFYSLNRAKAMWGRTNLDSYQADSTLLMMNDPSAFFSPSIIVDTFRVESDGSTSLACLNLHLLEKVPLRGTVLLLHSERADRSSLRSLAQSLADSGFGVVVYDQRASGLSTGKYHGDGRMEAADMEAVIRYLGLHNQLTGPVIVAGWKLGADAALVAATEERRISAVLAVEPYLSSNHMIDSYRAEFSGWWFPLYRSVIWFWYNARSSYGLEYRNDADLPSVACRTVMMTAGDPPTDQTIRTLAAKSGTFLTLAPTTTDPNKLVETIVTLASSSNTSNQ